MNMDKFGIVLETKAEIVLFYICIFEFLILLVL